jgi:subfamily B ATP-binding cassette protein MsbA
MDMGNNKSGKESWQLYLRIIGYLRPYIKQIILILLFNFFFVIFNTLAIWMVAPVVSTLFETTAEDTIQTQDDSSIPEEEPGFLDIHQQLKLLVKRHLMKKDRLDTLKLLCFILFLAFFLKNTFNYLEAWFVSFIEQKVIKDFRDQVYAHLLKLPLSFFHKMQTGNLISRVTNDINALNVAINKGFTKIIRDPIIIIIFIYLLFNISWKLSLVSLLVFPVSGALIKQIGRSLQRKSERVQRRIADITSILQETLTGMKVVKAFSMEKYERDKFVARTDTHYRAVLKQVRLFRLSPPLSETIGIGIMACVLWFGGGLVFSGQLLSSKDFITFIAILYAVLDPIKSLGDLNNNIHIALASAKRVFMIMDTPITITDASNAVEKKHFNTEICFNHVSFHYKEDEAPVLKKINLTVQKNQKIALVGHSGAGKTTLVNLIPRFYDIQRGSITVDGIDIREIKIKNLRDLLGIVTQEVILFNDTIANNIAYGRADYPLEKVKNAAQLANADTFIEALPEGYQTVIGEQGMRLSGGQRQRISIARAILKNPAILIFDEATSSLDTESERLIQEAIENLMRDRTVFLIAHRLSTVINADIIVVLDEGKILATGPHKELLGKSPEYRRLYELQFNA